MIERTNTIITLTTDFGLSDGYVAAIKGVILSRAPSVTIVDLCHAIPPQDITRAAYLLQESAPYFPPGTIHVVVVDPGVGSARAIILLVSGGHYFLAPDNGVVGLMLSPGAKVFRAERPDLHRTPVSPTFHGRDIIAPLAAHLAAGHPPESIGPALDPAGLTPLPIPLPAIDRQGQRIAGAIIRVDHFGNLITNISRADLAQLPASPGVLTLTLGPHRLRSWHDTYSQAGPAAPLILINSAGLVEVAINRGNAANHLSAKIHDPVILSVC